jgi:glycopeptide antibiotics resistance protein
MLIYRSNAMRYVVALVFCAMGIGLEYIQGLTDYRGFEYSDMFINSTGVGLGLLLSHTRLRNTPGWLESLVLRRTA